MRRVAVFIDWQNCYHCAREAFHAEIDPSRYGNIRPKAFAQMLVEKGNAGDQLAHVGIYRGEPGGDRLGRNQPTSGSPGCPCSVDRAQGLRGGPEHG